MMTISVKSMYRFMARLLTYKFVQDIVVLGNINFSRYLYGTGTGVDFCVITTGSLPQKIQNSKCWKPFNVTTNSTSNMALSRNIQFELLVTYKC